MSALVRARKRRVDLRAAGEIFTPDIWRFELALQAPLAKISFGDLSGPYADQVPQRFVSLLRYGGHSSSVEDVVGNLRVWWDQTLVFEALVE